MEGVTNEDLLGRGGMLCLKAWKLKDLVPSWGWVLESLCSTGVAARKFVSSSWKDVAWKMHVGGGRGSYRFGRVFWGACKQQQFVVKSFPESGVYEI